MGYPDATWERAMKVQDVILKALSGEIHWFRAAEIVGLSPRSLRRWRERYEAHGYDGLIDKRHRRPSQRRVPIADVERALRLYRERYAGFNVRHFYEVAQREHGVQLSYSFVKLDQLLKKQFPGKPVRYVAVTHPHRDHIAGVRAFAALGATILVETNHAAEMTRIVDARHSYPPDELERSRRSQQKVGGIETYDGKKVISDGGRTLELYAAHPPHPSPGVGDPSDTIVFAYVPSERVVFASDFGGKPLVEAVTKVNLRPERMLNGHGAQQGLRPPAGGSGVTAFAAVGGS